MRYIVYIHNMTIQNLVDVVKGIVLDDLGMSSYYVGNSWDMSTGKADTYPNCWFEMPVLVNYNVQNKQYKTFVFSLDFLKLPEMDNTSDEILKISECEVLADKFLSYLKQDSDFSLVETPTGLSVKSINADNACGIRLDIRVNAKRECL